MNDFFPKEIIKVDYNLLKTLYGKTKEEVVEVLKSNYGDKLSICFNKLSVTHEEYHKLSREDIYDILTRIHYYKEGHCEINGIELILSKDNIVLLHKWSDILVK